MKLNDAFIKENVADECVLVPTGGEYKNGVFVLNETAERIYDLLHEGKERDGIVAVLCEEYDTDRATAGTFVDEYIAKLREAGILTDD